MGRSWVARAPSRPPRRPATLGHADRQLGSLVDEEVAAPVALRATWAARAFQGLSFLRSFLAHRRRGGDPGAAGGRQLSMASAPVPHCQNLTVPWQTEDQGPGRGGGRNTAVKI